MRIRTFLDYLGITVGSAIVALGLVWFLIPHKIAAGGVSGLATVLYYLFSWPVGVSMLVLNIPLFVAGIRKLGIPFGIRTLFGTLVLSLLIDVLQLRVVAPTQNPLLASIYGGVLVGIGLGLVFRSRGTTGGTDLAAQLFHGHLRVSIGQTLLVIDALVIGLAAVVFGLELALYALIALFATSWMVDIVQEGLGYAKAALVITNCAEEISHMVLEHLDRGATILEGRGAYTGQQREVLLVVVSRAEVTRLKSFVYEVDPRAFVIVTEVHEALGEGFKHIRRDIVNK
ncbi:MAG: YitT family protein [Bacillota bacterium]